jgi:hypothetical protein
MLASMGRRVAGTRMLMDCSAGGAALGDTDALPPCDLVHRLKRLRVSWQKYQRVHAGWPARFAAGLGRRNGEQARWQGRRAPYPGCAPPQTWRCGTPSRLRYGKGSIRRIAIGVALLVLLLLVESNQKGLAKWTARGQHNAPLTGKVSSEVLRDYGQRRKLVERGDSRFQASHLRVEPTSVARQAVA